MKATVISDASFCPNTGAAGYGVWIASNAGRIKRSGSFRKSPASPYQAELWAVCNGIALAIKNGVTDILVQTDCKGVVHNLKSEDAYHSVIKGHDVTVMTKHVKGHTKTKDRRSYVNRWCDEAAKVHMRLQRQEFSLKIA